MKEETPDERFKRLWKFHNDRLADVRKLMYDFHEAFDSDTINGNKKKGLPVRTDLQLQIELYRQEARRIGEILIRMVQTAYEPNGAYKRLRTELFEV